MIGFDIEVARLQPQHCHECGSEDVAVDLDEKWCTCRSCEYSGESYKFMNPNPPGPYNLGIICADAVWIEDGVRVHEVWTGDPEMTKEHIREMVIRLSDISSDHGPIVTMNGAWFDFAVLAHESGMQDICAEMCLEHIDLLAVLKALNGWSVGLDALATGMGLGGKLHDVDGVEVSGALAPELWAKGMKDEVLKYLAIDSEKALEVALEGFSKSFFRFQSSSGRWWTVRIPAGVTPTVEWCIKNPYRGSTSWMSNYITTKAQVMKWMDLSSIEA